MYYDRTAWSCAFFVGKKYVSKDIHKEMLPIWAAFICGYPLLHPYFFAHKKRKTPRCSIVVHVFRDAAIL
jgi:hypothetical protein